MRVGGEGEATPRGGLLAGHRQGREVPEGRTQNPQHPQRDTASWTQARKGSPREAYPIEHSTPSGYCYLDASKGGKPSRDVSQRVLLDVHFRGRVLGLQNGVVRVLCITR